MRPTNRLLTVYRKQVPNCPFWTNWEFSLRKVENVVNPPHRPTVRNSFMEEPSQPPCSEQPQNRPMKKHPTTLTKKVPNGNESIGKRFSTHLDRQQRSIPPKQLPSPTNRRFFSINKGVSYYVKAVARKPSTIQQKTSHHCTNIVYPKNEINTPAATAEPITPEMLLAMQYCRT